MDTAFFPPDNALPGPDTALASPDPSGPGPARTEHQRDCLTDRLIHATDRCDLGGNRPYGVTKPMDVPTDVPSSRADVSDSRANGSDRARAAPSRRSDCYNGHCNHILFTQHRQNRAKTPQSSSHRIQGLGGEAPVVERSNAPERKKQHDRIPKPASTPRLTSPTKAEQKRILSGLQMVKIDLPYDPLDLTSSHEDS